MDTGSIDKRSNLSYKEFEQEYLFPRKPVVITDATAVGKHPVGRHSGSKNNTPTKL